MKRTLPLLFLAFSFHCHADNFPDLEPSESLRESNSYINLLGASADVAGCVNAITGDFYIQERDMAIVGTRPLVLERNYSSAVLERGSVCFGWNWNHGGIIDLDESKKRTYCKVASSRGSKLEFSNKKKAIGKNGYVYKLRDKCIERGATNVRGGIPSGRTNLSNTSVSFNAKASEKNRVTMEDGSGSIWSFSRQHSKAQKRLLTTILKSNKSSTFYSYHNDTIKKIKTFTSSHVLSGEVFFELNGSLPTRSHGSNGMKGHYTYSPYEVNDKTEYILTRVIRDSAPENWYLYEEGTINETYKYPRIVEAWAPNYHFRKVKYYNEGKNKIGSSTTKIKESKSLLIGRVAAIYAPVGVDHKSKRTHKFIYRLSDAEGKCGATDVFDRNNNRKEYKYQNSRLVELVHYQSEFCPYSKEKYYWSKDQGLNAGNLITFGLTDCYNRFAILRNYVYDERGNILSERTYGNLTGRSEGCPDVSMHHLPIQGSSDCYEVAYGYHDRGNNLKSYMFDGLAKITYDYDFDRDLMTSKFTTHDGEICERCFYIYNNDGHLICEIADDGSASDRNDISGVTERHITYIKPAKQPAGYPEEVKTCYWDQETREEKQLSRTVYHYSLRGQPIKEDLYDANDNYIGSTHKEYCLHGNIIKNSDLLGRVTEFVYNNNDKLTGKMGPRPGYVEKYLRDYSDRIVSKQYHLPDGTMLATHYNYSLLHELVGESDFSGNKTHHRYDFMKRRVGTTTSPVPDEEGAFSTADITFAYDVLGNPVKQVDGNGNTTTCAYTATNLPSLITTARGAQERKYYHADGRVEEEFHSDGTITRYRHDYKRRPVEIALYAPDGTLLCRTTKRYSAFRLLSETDNGGYTSDYSYDGAGRLIASRRGDSVTRYEYDSRGNKSTVIIKVDGAAAIKTRYEYDLLNRLVSEKVEAEGGILQGHTEYGYDCDGNRTHVIRHTDAGAAVTVTCYDALGRVVEVADAEGNKRVTRYLHDYRNRWGQTVAAVETIDPMGMKTLVVKDSRGRNAEVIKSNPFGLLLQQSRCYHDNNGNILKRIDDVIVDGTVTGQQTTIWKYDCNNAITTVILAYGTPDEKLHRYYYDVHGRKVATVKADFTTINYQYDLVGRLSRYASSDGTVDYRYEYDSLNNPIAVYDTVSESVTSRVYDMNGNITEETLAHGATISYGHDLTGRIVEACFPDGSTLKNRYCGSQLASVAKFDSAGVEAYRHHYLSYDLSGSVKSQKGILETGTSEFSYDILGRIRGLFHSQWKETLDAFDSSGNLLSRTLIDSRGSVTDSYGYDDLYQLNKESGQNTHSYNYDSLYNRKARDGSPCSHNSLNQIIAAAGATYDYDANGNMTASHEEDVSTYYSYDANDRLVSVIAGSVKTEYRYDAFNRRLSKERFLLVDSSWVPLQTERFLYLHQNEIGTLDDNNAFIEFRLLGRSLGAEISAAVAIERNGSLYSPIHDHNGNLACLLESESGEPLQYCRYSAYGEEEIFDLQGEVAEALVSWRFSSKRCDTETGWIFFGRRHYSPSLGRWTTPDPAKYKDGPNLYAYVHNNPLTHYDLYGLFDEESTETLDRDPICWFGAPGEDTSVDVLDLICDAFIATLHLIEQTGGLIESTAHHCAIGDSRTIGKAIGRAMQGKSLFDPDDSKYIFTGKVGERDMGSKVSLFSTGILTSKENCRNHAESLSSRIDDGIIHYMGAQSHGLVTDLGYCLMERVGLQTPATIELAQHVQSIYDETVAMHGQAELISTNHSRGAIDHHLSRQLCSEALRNNESVFNLGGGKMCPNGDFNEVSNYRNNYDLVPLTDCFSFSRDDVNIIKTGYSSGSLLSPINDHLLGSEGYQKVLMEIANEIMEKKQN